MVTMREKKIIPQLQSHGYRDESETPWQPFVAMEKCLFPKRNGWENTPYYYFGCSFNGDNDQPLNTAQLTLSCREAENCDTKVKHSALILKANFLQFALKFFRLASSQQIFAYKHENLHATMAIYLQPYQSLEGTNRVLIEENTLCIFRGYCRDK